MLNPDKEPSWLKSAEKRLGFDQLAKEHHDKRVTPTARDALKHGDYVHGDFHAYRKGLFDFYGLVLNLSVW